MNSLTTLAANLASSATFVGQIDERGYLNGFTKRGYTPPKCLLELTANILDSQDKVQSQHLTRKAVFDIQRVYTKIIDNGFGMNREAIGDMFALHRENHSSDASRGVAGIGAKPSLSILSQKTPVTLFTHRIGGDYLCTEIPWDTIHAEGCYTGMIKVRMMTDAEKAEFIRERSDNSMMNGNEYHGTTIRFKTNDLLEDTIHQNFVPIQESELQDPLDRIDVVFGKENTEFIMKHYEKREPTKLELYNYFKGSQADFLTGISEDIVEQYSTPDGNTHRFIWRKANGEAWEIVRHGKAGWSTKPELSTTNNLGLIHAGNYIIKTGFRIDDDIFDPEEPAVPVNSSSYGSFVEQFIGLPPMNREYVSFSKIYRNNQVLGLVHPDLSLGNSRANFEMHLEIDLIQCEIYFNPISSQDNLQDRAMGTQENKNQFNPNGPPKHFIRLIKAIRHAKALEVKNAMDELIPQEEEVVTPPPARPVPPVITPQVEQQEEQEDTDSDEEEKERQATTLDEYIRVNRIPPSPPVLTTQPAEVLDDESEVEEEGVRGETIRNRIEQLQHIIEDDVWYTNPALIALCNQLDEILSH